MYRKSVLQFLKYTANLDGRWCTDLRYILGYSVQERNIVYRRNYLLFYRNKKIFEDFSLLQKEILQRVLKHLNYYLWKAVFLPEHIDFVGLTVRFYPHRADGRLFHRILSRFGRRKCWRIFVRPFWRIFHAVLHHVEFVGPAVGQEVELRSVDRRRFHTFLHLLIEHRHIIVYCLSKKPWPNVYSSILYKMDQDFSDIWYINSTFLAKFSWIFNIKR